MTITAGSGASTGNYDITIRAQGEDGMVRSTVYSLTVTAYTPPPPPPEEGVGIPTIAWAGLGLGIGLVVVMMVLKMRRGPEEWAEGAKVRPEKGKEKEPEF
jgi:hypothetical protein